MGQTTAVSSGQIWYTDKKAAIKAVKQQGDALQHVSNSLRADKEVVLQAVKRNGYALQFAEEKLRAHEDVVLEAVKQDGLALMHASRELRSSKSIVLEAVKQRGQALQLASDDLRADPEVVLEAVKEMGHTFKYASPGLRSDRDFVLEVVKVNGEAFQHASEDLCGDREIVFEAVQRWGTALRFASLELKADKDIVWTAVKHSGRALRFASEHFQADKEVLLLAARSMSTPKDIVTRYMEKAGVHDHHNFWAAVDSRVAISGETSAPTVSVTLSRVLEMDGDSGRERVTGSINCEVVLMSGVNFSFHFPERAGRHEGERPDLTLSDLALLVVNELPERTEVRDVERVFMNFILNDDGDAIAVSPWDWRRPISDFYWSTNEGL